MARSEAIRIAKYSELLDHENDMVVHLSGEERSRIEEAIARAGGHVHEQESSRNVWTVRHNMGKYPSVATYTCTSGSMSRIFGDVEYPDENTVVIRFSASVSGVAYLN